MDHAKETFSFLAFILLLISLLLVGLLADQIGV